MKRTLLLVAALLLGLVAGEMLTRNFSFRAWLGRVVRRGELQALVGTRGIYDRDVRSAQRSLQSLIDEAKVQRAAVRTPVSHAAIGREMELLRAQLPNGKAWDALLSNAGISARALRHQVTENLRSRAWLEAKIAAAAPNEQEERREYDTHLSQFQEPLRFRACHLFLAAPEGYPEEVITAKRNLINVLAARLKNGEDFVGLVAEFSEDEATKHHDGDLNCFAASRMLPAVWDAVENLPVGEPSAPVRSRLGFHLLRLTERLPARLLTFEEARPEIVALLEDQRRTATLRGLLTTLNN